MLIYLLLCGGKLWRDACHFITMKNWKWHRIVSGRLGRLPNGAISLVMSDLHSNFPLHFSSIQEIQLQAFQILSTLLKNACMHAHPKTNACPHRCTPGKKRCLSFSTYRVGITLLGSSRIVKSNVCWSMEAENHWIQKARPSCAFRQKKEAGVIHMQQSSHMTWKLKLLGILSTQSRRYKTKDTENATIPSYSSCILPLTPLTLLTLAVEREEFVQTCDFYWCLYCLLGLMCTPPLQAPLPMSPLRYIGS